MGLFKRLLGLIGAIFGGIGSILGAIFGIFRRRPQSGSAQETAFFLDQEDAKSLGRQNESPRSAEPVAVPPTPEPVAAKPAATPTLVWSSGSPDLTNRRRPGPNMSSFLDMAKQMRRA